MMRKSILLILILALLLQLLPAYAVVGDPSARFAGIPTIEQDGALYRLNRRLTTILLMGVDSSIEKIAQGTFRDGGQADFLALVVIDDSEKTINVIQINRDTVVDLKVFNTVGMEIGTRKGQICLAHGMADGSELSCELTVDAVSKLLNDTPIDYYMRMTMDGIPALNDALGGVEVTLEEDFSMLDPAMTAGTTLTLHGMQAEYYTRGRMEVGDGTNLARIDRQRNYLYAAIPVLRQRISENPGFVRTLYAALEPYLTSSISRGAFYNIADKASRYDAESIVEIDGETRIGWGGYTEFYPDEAALNQVLIDILYDRVDS